MLRCARSYSGGQLRSDLVAAVVVTTMLIPQSLGYALFSGVPPQVSIYASIPAADRFRVFGSSPSLAVGPGAVVSLMIASGVGRLAPDTAAGYVGVFLYPPSGANFAAS